jgi:hypothetical protein
MLGDIITNLSNCPELHRFQGYKPTKWDYTLDGDGNVMHYPDPPCGYWRNREAPRFGLACFAPMDGIHYGSFCATLNSSSFAQGWRLVHTDDITFRTATLSKVVVKHYLLYPATPMTVSKFLEGLDAIVWRPCSAHVACRDVTLIAYNEATHAQPSISGTTALRVLKEYFDRVELDPMELLHLAGAQYEIAIAKKPIQYLRLPTLQRLLRILESHDAPIVDLVYEYHENLCALLRKAIISVSLMGHCFLFCRFTVVRDVQKGCNPDDSKSAEQGAAASMSPFESEDEGASFSDEDDKEPHEDGTPGTSPAPVARC